MSLNLGNLYYCNHCKKVLSKLEDLLFVEEGSNHCFCSEDCIELYYKPLVDYFANEITKLKKDLNLNEKDANELLENNFAIEKLLSRPDEIYRFENDIKEDLYTYISYHTVKGKKIALIALCFVFNQTPSFVFALTSSANDYFVQTFQKGELVDSFEEYNDDNQLITADDIDPETIEELERLKSKFLADLMENVSDTDIQIEQYDLYMDYLQETLEKPDEVFQTTDDGEAIRTYVRGHQREGVSFFYIAICLLYSSDDTAEIILPIISFPTIDGKLTDHFRAGKQISGGLKN